MKIYNKLLKLLKNLNKFFIYTYIISDDIHQYKLIPEFFFFSI